MPRWPLLIIAVLLAGCKAPPTEEQRLAALPNVRPLVLDVPNEKAILQVQAETFYLRLDADPGESWSYAGSVGLEDDQVKRWLANGLRVGTMDALAVSQFLAKLPPTGGSKQLRIGVGHEPVVIETTPALPRGVTVRALLGPDRDETISLPSGRMQLLLDVVLGGEAVTMTVTPHHHWVTQTVLPRTPHEKLFDGRLFKELALDVDVTGDRYLVIGWQPPATPTAPTTPSTPAAPAAPPAPPAPAATTAPIQHEDGAAPDPPGPDAPPQAAPDPTPARTPTPPPAPPPRPRLGDVLLTGTRADRPMQLICIIRIPPQGDALPAAPARSEESPAVP